MIEKIKNWIAVQKQDLPVNAQIDIARTEGFYQGALKTVTALENVVRVAEEEQLEKDKAQIKEEKKEEKK